MKRTILSLLSLALVVSFTACEKNRPRQMPAQGPRTPDVPPTRYVEAPDPDAFPPERKTRDDVVDPTPAPKHNIPAPPTPSNPEYAIKVDGKPGYVKSPYDSQGRLIDVRGLPPGTEAECPYSRRTFLVPP
jgi:predicted small lipoprotein YifL